MSLNHFGKAIVDRCAFARGAGGHAGRPAVISSG